MIQNEHVDVLIVGAGLAGIGFARHLQMKCPQKSYAVVEARKVLGGTWDLFRYPGIRSDSNMHVYGYTFCPWIDDKSIAPGELILRYLKDVASKFSISKFIQYNKRVSRAEWSSETARWTVTIEDTGGGKPSTLTCNWLQMCTGYFSYESGYCPEFPGRNKFRKEIIHPQQWPKNFDATGKRIVVIGSGATAITLIPSLAKKAKHVVMLQRSPSYIHAEPDEDSIAKLLRRFLPEQWAYRLIRWKNIRQEKIEYDMTRKDPEGIKTDMVDAVRKALPEGFDVDSHFTPHYNPWDQRVCFAPNGDIFKAISDGTASVETDEILAFSETGLELASGKELAADVIVTATGLNMIMAGNIALKVDDVKIDLADTWLYKGLMFSGVPNLAIAVGSLTASYTLRIELMADYVCRLLQYKEAIQRNAATPQLPMPISAMPVKPFAENFSSGYLARAWQHLPKQGDTEPWLNLQSYAENKRVLSADVDDGVLKFTATQ